jgi:hypothetical protein
LIKGNRAKNSLFAVDMKFTNKDYVTQQRNRYSRALSTSLTGVSHTFDAPDMFAEQMRRLISKNPDVIKDSCMGGKDKPFFISFQSSQMGARSTEVFNSKQVDTIMSLSKSKYLQGNVWVTMTSTYDVHLCKQVPCLVTVHLGMTTRDYECHFDTDNSNFHHLKHDVNDSIEHLMSRYPGHTMDMSGALYKGWVNSFKRMCQDIFGIADIPDEALQSILRLCTVHFKMNARRVSNISRCVHPNKARQFRKMCRELIREDITFDYFEETVMNIAKEFRKTRGWLAWYLHSFRAPHLFPACNQSRNYTEFLGRFEKLEKDTNAQEGFGGFLKTWVGTKQSMKDLLWSIFEFVQTYDTSMRLQRMGLDQSYSIATRANKKKHGKREKKTNYKGPDTYKDLVRENEQNQNVGVTRGPGKRSVVRPTREGSMAWDNIRLSDEDSADSHPKRYV